MTLEPPGTHIPQLDDALAELEGLDALAPADQLDKLQRAHQSVHEFLTERGQA